MLCKKDLIYEHILNIMNDRSVFSISQQTAGRDIYNIARDLNINQNSLAEDVLKIFEAIQYKVGELDISEKEKGEISDHLEDAKIGLKKKDPDKKSIEESIKKTGKILKEAKTTGETLKEIGSLIGKAALWLGTTAAKLGWIL